MMAIYLVLYIPRTLKFCARRYNNLLGSSQARLNRMLHAAIASLYDIPWEILTGAYLIHWTRLDENLERHTMGVQSAYTMLMTILMTAITTTSENLIGGIISQFDSEVIRQDVKAGYRAIKNQNQQMLRDALVKLLRHLPYVLHTTHDLFLLEGYYHWEERRERITLMRIQPGHQDPWSPIQKGEQFGYFTLWSQVGGGYYTHESGSDYYYSSDDDEVPPTPSVASRQTVNTVKRPLTTPVNDRSVRARTSRTPSPIAGPSGLRPASTVVRASTPPSGTQLTYERVMSMSMETLDRFASNNRTSILPPSPPVCRGPSPCRSTTSSSSWSSSSSESASSRSRSHSGRSRSSSRSESRQSDELPHSHPSSPHPTSPSYSPCCSPPPPPSIAEQILGRKLKTEESPTYMK